MTRRNPYEVQKPRAIDISGRAPPHDEGAEAAVLSAVLCGGDVGTRALDTSIQVGLLADHFYFDAHVRIWTAIVELRARGVPVDIQTVASELKDRERLQAIGGVSYLVKIVDATPSVANVGAHAAIVAAKAAVRRMIGVCQTAAASGHGDYGTAEDFLAKTATEVLDAAEKGTTRSKPSGIREVVGKVAEHLIAMREGRVSRTGIRTGIRALDRMLAGLRRAKLYLVAGRPGMGKTSLALNVADNAAGTIFDDHEIGVAVFSLEMEKDEVASSIACSRGRINARDFANGKADEAIVDRLYSTVAELEAKPIWIDDSPSLSPAEIEARVRRIKADWERAPAYDDQGRLERAGRRVGIVVVDYLQLVSPGEGRFDSREQEVSSISRAFKTASQRLGVAMIVLSQLNRGLESRQDKRPQLSDLRESGSLEQDADAVIFMFRAYAYLHDKETEEARKLEEVAEAIIAKQRGGPQGTLALRWEGAFTRFSDPVDTVPDGA